MSSINKKKTITNHNGGNSVILTPYQELERLVFTSFLWEDSFYEKGSDQAERVKILVQQVTEKQLEELILQARHDMHLRHIPLYLIVQFLKRPHKLNLSDLINSIIVTPKDATELLALYWKDGKVPLAGQLKRGLAMAMTKFSEHQLAKYQNASDIKIRDIFNMVHPKPKNKEQAKIFKKLMTKGLPTADTWETRLSAEGNTAEIWKEFLAEGKLGGLAFLRNLRNMLTAGVDKNIISENIDKVNFSRVLPFRFIAASRYAPMLEDVLESKMFEGVKQWGTLKGKTILLVDVSGSMDYSLSDKSDMTRMDAATALAIMLREVGEDVEIFTFSDRIVPIPNRRGFGLKDAIINSQRHANTYLGAAIKYINDFQSKADRLIVFTDEQSNDLVPDSLIEKSYMVNVASYNKSVATKKWISISGFSEKIVDFIQMLEQL